jgi:HlyD family secretion protein
MALPLALILSLGGFFAWRTLNTSSTPAVNVSSATASSSATITVINPSQFYVDLSLSESDVGAVAVGQPVALTFDALSDVKINGAVQAVAPVATVTSNVATYTVRVSFVPGDAAIRAGMTATGAIQTATHANALLVPTRAIQTVNGAKVIQVQRVGQPPAALKVTTGLASDGQTEILGCVDSSAQCVQAGDTVLITTSATSTTSTTTGSTTSLLGGPPAGGPPPGGQP